MNCRKRLALIFLIGLLCRIFSVLFLWGGASQVTGVDSYFYDPIARNLAMGKGYSLDGIHLTADRVPVLPLLLAFLYLRFNYNVAIVKLILALIGSLGILLIYLLGKIEFNQKVGLIAAWTFAVLPIILKYSTYVNSETLFMILLLGGLIVFSNMKKGNLERNAIASGILIGLATLTRPVTLILPFLTLIWIFFQHEWNFKLRWKLTAIFISSFMLVLLPWVTRNYIVFKTFVISTRSGEALYLAHYPTKGNYWMHLADQEMMATVERLTKNMVEVEREHYLRGLGLKYLLTGSKWLLLKCVLINEIVILSPIFLGNPGGGYDVQFGLIFPFFILGIWYAFKAKLLRRSILILPILNLFLITSVFHGDPRYRFPFLPYMIIFGGYGFVHLRVRQTKLRFHLIIFVTIVANLLLNFLVER